MPAASSILVITAEDTNKLVPVRHIQVMAVDGYLDLIMISAWLLMLYTCTCPHGLPDNYD